MCPIADSRGSASPGPAAMYHKKDGLEGARYSFGTNERFQRQSRMHSDAAELPGPGSYSADSTLGSQRSSRLTTQPAFGFGSSNREHSARVFVSDLHSKSSSTSFSASPGPGLNCSMHAIFKSANASCGS